MNFSHAQMEATLFWEMLGGAWRCLKLTLARMCTSAEVNHRLPHDLGAQRGWGLGKGGVAGRTDNGDTSVSGSRQSAGKSKWFKKKFFQRLWGQVSSCLGVGRPNNIEAGTSITSRTYHAPPTLPSEGVCSRTTHVVVGPKCSCRRILAPVSWFGCQWPCVTLSGSAFICPTFSLL